MDERKGAGVEEEPVPICTAVEMVSLYGMAKSGRVGRMYPQLVRASGVQ